MEYSLQERIIILLKRTPSLRNNPDKLIYAVWMNEVSVEHQQMPTVEFMRKVYTREIKITSPTTINRTRQEIQRQFPELAGDKDERMKKANTIRKNIVHTNLTSIKHDEDS